MTETIKWSETSDKDKVRSILANVMGYFVLEETTKGYHTPEIPNPVPSGFHWPVAFWNTDSDCWAYKDIADNGVTFFDPLHNMNDAWMIVEKMCYRMGYDHIGFEWRGPMYKPVHNYFSSCQHDEIHKTGHFDYTQGGGFSLGDPCWYIKYMADEPRSILYGRVNWIMADTPQEAICIAALRIEGVGVEK